MNSVEDISALLAIADLAITVDDLEGKRRFCGDALGTAYGEWKERHGIERVERDTLDWVRMMSATKPEYESLQETKRNEKNARRRLATAIRRYRQRRAA